MNNSELIQYKTSGTCSRLIQVEIEEDKIKNIQFLGGCNGNLKGIKNLVTGMPIEEVILKLNGITCGDKTTSCPDQLAKCLLAYAEQKNMAIK